jgi:hypothetical protein
MVWLQAMAQTPILRMIHVQPQMDDLFRQPFARRIDDAANPPAGVTLIVPTPTA